jgi:hypothetical protein
MLCSKGRAGSSPALGTSKKAPDLRKRKSGDLCFKPRPRCVHISGYSVSMASLRKRATKAGSVRWRQGEVEVSESFPTEAGAIKFRGLVDSAGQRYPEGWAPGRGFIQVESEGGPTLAQWFQRAVDSRPGANNRTRSDYRRDFVTHVPEWLASKPIETITREDVGKWLVKGQ